MSSDVRKANSTPKYTIELTNGAVGTLDSTPGQHVELELAHSGLGWAIDIWTQICANDVVNFRNYIK